MKGSTITLRVLRQAERSLRPARQSRRHASNFASSSTIPTRSAYSRIGAGVITAGMITYAVFRQSSSELHCEVPGSGRKAHDPLRSKDYEDEPELVPTVSTEDSDVIDNGESSALAELREGKGTGEGNVDVGDYISMNEVARHGLAHDAWVVIDGEVYDVTDFLKYHPGGAKIIVSNAGRDVTELYKAMHPPGLLENNLAAECHKGMVNPKEAAKSLEGIEAEKERIRKAREGLPPVETILGLDEMQAVAESFLSPRVQNYYAAASLDGLTLTSNLSSFHKCRLIPRILRNVSTISPQTTIFGCPSALPIYISPASNALLGHPDGELNLTRGAARTGIVQGVSAAASFPLTEILEEKAKMDEELAGRAEAVGDIQDGVGVNGDGTTGRAGSVSGQGTGGKMGMVYQVYVQTDRGRTEEIVREAVAGGVQALMLTVDTAVLGHRQSTDKLIGTRNEADPGIKMGPFNEWPPFHDPRLNWDDLDWLKDMAKGIPIYLKGVCHIDDVRKAKEYNLAGCILSNHGGRQCDQARTAFDSLRSIHAEDPQLLKDIEVYIDGGVRRGTDVLQAIAFGARGIGLGRPFLWAQAAYGEKGVIRAIRILENEIVLAMRLLGVTSLDQVDTRMVECLQEMWK